MDFLLITDDQRNYQYPNNVTVIYKTFKEIQKSIKEKIAQNA